LELQSHLTVTNDWQRTWSTWMIVFNECITQIVHLKRVSNHKDIWMIVFDECTISSSTCRQVSK
jgi:hypothetical protein